MVDLMGADGDAVSTLLFRGGFKLADELSWVAVVDACRKAQLRQVQQLIAQLCETRCSHWGKALVEPDQGERADVIFAQDALNVDLRDVYMPSLDMVMRHVLGQQIDQVLAVPYFRNTSAEAGEFYSFIADFAQQKKIALSVEAGPKRFQIHLCLTGEQLSDRTFALPIVVQLQIFAIHLREAAVAMAEPAHARSPLASPLSKAQQRVLLGVIEGWSERDLIRRLELDAGEIRGRLAEAMVVVGRAGAHAAAACALHMGWLRQTLTPP